LWLRWGQAWPHTGFKMNAANDNRIARPLRAPVSMAAIACLTGGRVTVEIPGCPVVVTRLTSRTGKTQGFELALDGAVVGLLGAKATYNHLEAACRRIKGGVAWAAK